VTVITRIHSGVFGGGGALVEPHGGYGTTHLRQSDVDGACGPHCVFMALVALGAVSRSWMTHGKGKRERSPRAAMWRLAAPMFMTGTEAADLAAMLKPLRSRVAVEVCLRGDGLAVKFAIQALLEQKLVVLGLHNWSIGLDHWVLGVGLQGSEATPFQPQRLLLLDPGVEALPLAQWNAVLWVERVDGRRSRRLQQRDGAVVDVTLKHAVAIGLRKRRKRPKVAGRSRRGKT
jgi:hypothetical protein